MLGIISFGGTLFLVFLFLFFLFGIRFIPNNRIGLVEKRFSGKGSIKSGFIALHGRQVSSRRSCVVVCIT